MRIAYQEPLVIGVEDEMDIDVDDTDRMKEQQSKAVETNLSNAPQPVWILFCKSYKQKENKTKMKIEKNQRFQEEKVYESKTTKLF